MVGYDAVMLIAKEEPQWIPVIRACLDYPAEQFAGRWVLGQLNPRPRTLKPLLDKGVLVHSQEPSADGKTWYRFVDRVGVGRALEELGA